MGVLYCMYSSRRVKVGVVLSYSAWQPQPRKYRRGLRAFGLLLPPVRSSSFFTRRGGLYGNNGIALRRPAYASFCFSLFDEL